VERSTNGSDPKSAATVFPPGYAPVPASYLEFQQNGHTFNLDSVYKDYSTGFQS
jgi:hypothetical protein